MQRRAHGFTLIELLITLAIAGMLAALGAPAFGSLLARTRDAGAATAIAHALRHARSAAVMRGTRVLVCPSRDGAHCTPNDDWQSGWIIAMDGDHDGQPDADHAPITVQQALAGGTRVVTSAGRHTLTFHPNGSAGGSNVTFTICHAGAQTGKAIVVANSGRVRVASADPAHLQQCLGTHP